MSKRLRLCCVVLLACSLFQTGVLFGADQLDVGSGSFVFNDAEGNSGKPITVWYHRPQDLDADAKILFVMHGTSRTGKKYRDSWVRYSERFHLLLIAPEFSAEDYEGGRRYGRGNVLTKGESKIEESKWTLFSQQLRRPGELLDDRDVVRALGETLAASSASQCRFVAFLVLPELTKTPSRQVHKPEEPRAGEQPEVLRYVHAVRTGHAVSAERAYLG